MKIHQVEQGSPEWLELRLGIPTASCFDQIITPKTGKLSAQAKPYAYHLIAERLLNRPLESLQGLEFVERGKLLEPQAIAQYEFTYEVETQPVGFITTDDGKAGASPDRLIVGANAGLEVKCPAAWTHVGYLLDGPSADKYRPQVQGQLWVCDFEFVDFYSYFPEWLPAMHKRTQRDEEYIKLLAQAVTDFNEMLAELWDRALALGCRTQPSQLSTIVEAEYAEDLRKVAGF